MKKSIEPIYKLFGARVAQIRTALGWNQEELAAKMNHSRGSIANIEGGKQRVLLGDVEKFASVFGCKPMQLIRGIWI